MQGISVLGRTGARVRAREPRKERQSYSPRSDQRVHQPGEGGAAHVNLQLAVASVETDVL